MKTQSLVHDVPFPIIFRIFACMCGAIPLVMGPYELWSAFWPLNAATPVFGAFLIAAILAGSLVIYVGLFTPELQLSFSPNQLVVKERFPLTSRTTQISNLEIASIGPTRVEHDDGDTIWPVDIVLKSGKSFRSQFYNSETTAQIKADEFKQALGI